MAATEEPAGLWVLQAAAGAGEAHLTTLNGFCGRQTWVFQPGAGTPAERAAVSRARAAFASSRSSTHHSTDALLRLQALNTRAARGLPSPPPVPSKSALSDGSAPSPEHVAASLRAGVSFYQTLQAEDGHFPGDYGGPMFLLPGLVITCHVTGVMDEALPPPHRRELRRYLCNHQNDDGGFGLHIEGRSTMFGSVLSYVSLRLLGEPAESRLMTSSLAWITSHGGATAIPSWGKFWLAALGVYEWKGLNPMPPEMWLLPHALPVHPGRMWCHCRMVYLPMCYVFGKRFVGARSPVVGALRVELYSQPYADIDWNAARSRCCPEDLYYPHPAVQDAIWWVLHHAFEPLLSGSRLRAAALRKVMDHITYEDENTRYVDIGPVNKVINMLATWIDDPLGPAFKKHVARIPDYLWVAEDGMKMQGYNGSQLWDTAFAAQAILATPVAREFEGCLSRAHAYLDASQVREDCRPPLGAFYRHISAGAWPFSTRDHGWPISDCTAEGLKAALACAAHAEHAEPSPSAAPPPPPDAAGVAPIAPIVPIADSRLFDCVNIILSLQNRCGGWATYERTRSFAALELLNPAETFGDIMIDYPYVECTSASIQALRSFGRRFPAHRSREVAAAISDGVHYILSSQRQDGSWYGSWGVCFTYGAWFGLSGLSAAGLTWAGTHAIKAGVNFLLDRQGPDGGWGESYLASQDKTWSPLPGGASHCVNTSWALLALIASGQAQRDAAPLHAAARCLLRAQQPDGDWPQEHISGVFNRNCMISYSNYRNIFPIWALGEYTTKVLNRG